MGHIYGSGNAAVRRRLAVSSVVGFVAARAVRFVPPLIVIAILPAIIVAPVVTLLVARHVFLVVPVVLHEVDAFATGVVLVVATLIAKTGFAMSVTTERAPTNPGLSVSIQTIALRTNGLFLGSPGIHPSQDPD